MRSHSPRSTLSPVVPSTLKRAVYLLPVNQQLPKTPFFSSLLFTSLPPSLCCQFASLLPFMAGVKRPTPSGYYHHQNNHLMVVFVNGTVELNAVKVQFTAHSRAQTCALLFHIDCFCSVFVSFCLCFWGGTGEKQIRSVSAETCLVTKACSGGRLLGDMREETKVGKKKEKTRGHSFKFVFPSLRRQKRNLSMNSRVYS